MAANVVLTRSVSVYSAVNLIAAAGILGNIGGVTLAANTDLGNAISTYTGISVVSRYANIVAYAASNAGSAITYSTTAATFPALTNSLPTAYSGLTGSSMTGAINYQSNRIMGSGNLGKFSQVLQAAQGFLGSTNQLIVSTVAANSASSNVAFVNSDNVLTEGVSGVTQAFAAFSADLAQLGDAIGFANLNGLGSPDALLKQVSVNSTMPPAVNTALLEAGIPQDTINAIVTHDLTDSQQKLAYQAMTRVTGFDLLEVQSLLKCTIPHLDTMADLLDPTRLFPRSFNTLTAPTAAGPRGVYLDSSGAVNSNLATQLPPSVLRPLTGNPLQNIVVQQA